jgi:nucleotide-binding universal stress UspA family protein
MKSSMGGAPIALGLLSETRRRTNVQAYSGTHRWFRDLGQRILAAVKLAKVLGAKLTGFYAMEGYPVSPFADYVPSGIPSPEEFQVAQEDLAKKYLGILAREAKAAGVPYAVEYAASLSPYKAIIHAAEKNACDLILMASHGRRGMSGLLLGSETNKVLTHSKIPVLVYR